MIKNYLHYAVAAALSLTAGVSNVAFADVVELEAPGTTGVNDTVQTAQQLVIGSDRSATVTGQIGTTELLPVPAMQDVDWYYFDGEEDNKVTIDIDGGVKPTGGGRSLDTWIAILDKDLKVLRQIDDADSLDDGSIKTFDSRLDEVVLPYTGRYYVGVTAAPRKFEDGGTVALVNGRTNGTYKLIISGVTPPPSVQYILIDIRPGSDGKAPINLKSKGNIPVALLSSKTFNAMKADRDSIRFGPPNRNGTKPERCAKEGEDVNVDGYLDLVCHFDTQATGFNASDEEGIVKGRIEGKDFQGRGYLKMVPKHKD